MAQPTKRPQTDEARETLLASDASALSTGTPEDLAQRLRNIGSRVRRNVNQGYLTAPSSTSFTKAQSTGSIFRSMNDTLHDVFANTPSGVLDSQLPSRKRARSHSLTESEEREDSTVPMDLREDNNSEKNQTLNRSSSSRPMKSLRSVHHIILQTHSLPNGAIFLGESRRAAPGRSETVKEDDWSHDNSAASEPPFQPMTF
ncbi:hypothetical protein NLJ89_g1818 [Agrocybe chaxingu]|uniref:Uncharacterized protein n=1 Tax=Agrocybe chaxingu TaxID=84603 RepID=A0A9W8MZB7_9AGAR|nr:hypothetical protein NLJ89_g1818 [Agrocybe chaxingu]